MVQTVYEMKSTASIKNGDFVDLSEYLSSFFKAQTLFISLSFKTNRPNKMCLFSLCYREAVLPTFAILLWKGYIIIVRSSSTHAYSVLESDNSYCDGTIHAMFLKWNGKNLKVYVDNNLVIQEELNCLFAYRYTNSVFVGKCFYADDEVLHFDGMIKNVLINYELEVRKQYESSQLDQMSEKIIGIDQVGDIPAQCLFKYQDKGCCNYRIPSILRTKRGNLMATSDARIDCPGDNPNHIARAIRISKDAGATWSDIKIFHDCGGEGRRTGASCIDGAMVQDQDTERIFMLYSHSSQHIGSYNSVAGVGFLPTGKKQLFDDNEQAYYVEASGAIVDKTGEKTRFTLQGDDVFIGERNIGNVLHGICKFHQMNTTFLKLCYSDDEGETWSEAIDLNPSVKEPWMRFLGSCPGQGIQIHTGLCKDRLLLPVYYTNEKHKHSFAALYSNDHGGTWHRGNSVNDGRIVDTKRLQSKTLEDDMYRVTETSLIELEDGSIKAFMRNYYGQTCVLSAISKDGGQHFDDVKVETQLFDPNCQNASLRVSHKGKLLYFFCNPKDYKIRRNGILKISLDNANTWKDVAVVTTGDFGYSCLCMCDEETIGVLYEGKDVAIYFKKYKIATLLQNSM